MNVGEGWGVQGGGGGCCCSVAIGVVVVALAVADVCAVAVVVTVAYELAVAVALAAAVAIAAAVVAVAVVVFVAVAVDGADALALAVTAMWSSVPLSLPSPLLTYPIVAPSTLSVPAATCHYATPAHQEDLLNPGAAAPAAASVHNAHLLVHRLLRDDSEARWVVLDVLRLLLLVDTFAAGSCCGAADVWESLGPVIGAAQSLCHKSQTMLLRVLCNFFALDDGRRCLLAPGRLQAVADITCYALSLVAPAVRVTAAAAVHNIAVVAPMDEREGDACLQLFSALCQVVEQETQQEAIRVMLSAMYHFVRGSQVTKGLFRTLAPRLHRAVQSEDEGVQQNMALLSNELLSGSE